MGLWLSRMLSWFGDREARILVLGLDNAGKTTILCECAQMMMHLHRLTHLDEGAHAVQYTCAPFSSLDCHASLMSCTPHIMHTRTHVGMHTRT